HPFGPPRPVAAQSVLQISPLGQQSRLAVGPNLAREATRSLAAEQSVAAEGTARKLVIRIGKSLEPMSSHLASRLRGDSRPCPALSCRSDRSGVAARDDIPQEHRRATWREQLLRARSTSRWS